MPPIQESRERYLLFIPPRAALKSRQRPNRRPVDPAKPWTSDHLWHPARMKPDGAPSSRQQVLRRAAVLALIALLNLRLNSAYLILKIVAGARDLARLLILFDWVLNIG